MKTINNRYIWIDILRGLSIVLVILEHYSLLKPPSNFLTTLINFLNHFFSPIRIELLFFLSGMLVSLSIKKGAKIYFKGKIESILYPYFLWGVLTIALRMFIDKNSLDSIIRLFIGNISLIWFLYWLFIFFIVQFFLRKLSIYFIVPVLLGLSFICNYFGIEFYDRSFLRFGDIFYYYLYFYLGDLFWLNKEKIIDFLDKKIYSYLSLLSFIIIYILIFEYKLIKTNIIFFPVVIVSFISLIKFSFLLQTTKIGIKLGIIGRNSIVFYLLHFYVGLIYQIVISKLKIDNNFTILIGFLLMFIIPIIYVNLRNKYTCFNYLFSLKK